jgi:hypothetical protein
MFVEMPAGFAPEHGAEVAFELTVPPGEGYSACESKLRGAGRVVRKTSGAGERITVAVHFSQPLAFSLQA